MVRHRKSSGPLPTGSSVDIHGFVVTGASECLAGSSQIDRIEQGALVRAADNAVGVNASQAALAESEERYRSLVRAAGAIVWTTSAAGNFTDPQPGWEEYTGQNFAAYCNGGGMVMVHPEDRSVVSGRWTEATEKGIPFEAEYRLWHALSHRHRWCEVRGVPLLDAQGAVREWVGTITDIDERKGLAQERESLLERERVAREGAENRERTQRFLADLERRMRGCQEVSALAVVVTHALGEFLQVERCSWGEWDDAGQTVHIYPDYCPGVASIAGTYPLAAFGEDLVAPQRRGEAVIVEDVLTDPRAQTVREVFIALGVRAYLSVPLHHAGRCVAAFGVQSQGAPRQWTDEEVALLVEVAQRAWLVVENLRLSAQTQDALERERQARHRSERALDRLARLQMVTAVLSGAITDDGIVEAVVQEGLGTIGANTAFVARLNEAGDALELLHAGGMDIQSWQQYQCIPLEAPVPLAEAVRTLKPLWLGSTEERIERYPNLSGEYAKLPARFWVSVPLVVEGRAVGGLSLGFEGGPVLDEGDQGYILALAGQCAQALERARLYHQERKARAEAEEGRRRSEFLAGVSELLAGTLSYEAVLAQLARLAVPLLGDWCAVDVLGNNGQVKRLAVVHTDPEKVQWGYELQRRFPLEPGAKRGVVNVLRTGQSELYSEIPDALLVATARNPEHLIALREVGFSSAMIVPLSARGRTLGAVTLVMAESGRHYGEADLREAEDLARRAGLAVDNARLYDAEQQARRDAEQANRVKDDFLAVLSHELRTPLNPIIGWTQMLRRGKLSPTAQVDALEVIERNAKLQNQLIEDLLDVSRIEQGKFSHQPQPLAPGAVVHSAIEAVRSAAQAAQVVLVVEIPESLPEVEADPTRLSQVVWNLLINAIKFTPPLGRVEVRLEETPGRVRLVVSDTGTGIAAGFLPHLFERFRQADASSTRKQGGLGLGLFIVHHIVELHGGRVWAESEGEGQGSTFTVELPIAKGE